METMPRTKQKMKQTKWLYGIWENIPSQPQSHTFQRMLGWALEWNTHTHTHKQSSVLGVCLQWTESSNSTKKSQPAIPLGPAALNNNQKWEAASISVKWLRPVWRKSALRCSEGLPTTWTKCSQLLTFYSPALSKNRVKGAWGEGI